jgi:hypothetical protein
MLSRPSFHNTAQIPINIDYRATPRAWHVKKTTVKKTLESKGGRRRPQNRFFAQAKSGSQPTYFEPWNLRENFLSLETEADFLRFLNHVGGFSALGFDSHDWELRDFKGWQEVFRELLRRPLATWNQYLEDLSMGTLRFNVPLIRIALAEINKVRFLLTFDWQRKPQAGIIKVHSATSAIFATILIDHLRGATFRFCARHDCRKPFEIISKHKRKYCTQYCGHLEGLRKMRKRQRRGSGREWSGSGRSRARNKYGRRPRES